MIDLAKFIDHTILKPDATEKEVVDVCEQAKKYGFAAVCVNSYFVNLVKEQLKGSDIKVCSVVGFPLGAVTTKAKEFETKEAVEKGAQEIDMVMNIGAMKDKKYDIVENDIKAVVDACKGKAIVKVILETCLLTDEEIIQACKLSKSVGADFVKTSTGFSKAGANIKHVKLMRRIVGNDMGVKAAGGIRTYKMAMEMIEAGANRLGCSSSIAIIQEAKNANV